MNKAKKIKRKIKAKRKPGQKLLPAPQKKNLPVGKININLDPQALLAKAIDKDLPIEKLNQLVDLGERLQAKAAESAFRDAMSAFQSECPIIVKGTAVLNKDSNSVRYKFAQIDAIAEIIKPLLYNHGLSYQIKSKTIKEPFEGIESTVVARHIEGHSESSTFSAPIDKNMIEKGYMTAAQAWLSAKSFSARVALCDVFGIVTGEADWDGNNPKSPKAKTKEVIEAEEKQKNEVREKIEKLSDYIKDGFKVLGYTWKQVRLFCEKFEWNDNKIRFEIDKIVKANEGSK